MSTILSLIRATTHINSLQLLVQLLNRTGWCDRGRRTVRSDHYQVWPASNMPCAERQADTRKSCPPAPHCIAPPSDAHAGSQHITSSSVDFMHGCSTISAPIPRSASRPTPGKHVLACAPQSPAPPCHSLTGNQVCMQPGAHPLYTLTLCAVSSFLAHQAGIVLYIRRILDALVRLACNSSRDMRAGKEPVTVTWQPCASGICCG